MQRRQRHQTIQTSSTSASIRTGPGYSRPPWTTRWPTPAKVAPAELIAQIREQVIHGRAVVETMPSRPGRLFPHAAVRALRDKVRRRADAFDLSRSSSRYASPWRPNGENLMLEEAELRTAMASLIGRCHGYAEAARAAVVGHQGEQRATMPGGCAHRRRGWSGPPVCACRARCPPLRLWQELQLLGHHVAGFQVRDQQDVGEARDRRNVCPWSWPPPSSMALSKASGPSTMPPVIWPRSAILHSVAASMVDCISGLTVSTAASIATLDARCR